MKNDYFSRSSVKNGKYVVEEVKEVTYDLIPLYGNAVITYVGGNGMFRFNLAGHQYATNHGGVCFNYQIAPVQEYFDYTDVVFDRNIKEEWSKLYIYHESKEYWKPIQPKQII